MKIAAVKFSWLLFVIFLAGCTVKFVEDYDPVLDQGLTAYQSDIAAFLSKMSANASKPAGKFEAPDVQEFYARTGARLQSFVDRAEALDEEGTCLPANYVGDGIKAVVDSSADAIRNSGLAFGEVENIAGTIKSFGDGSEAVSEGNCTVVLVKVVQANQELLRLIHEENDALPQIVSDIAGETIQQSVRLAIKNEVLKKRSDG